MISDEEKRSIVDKFYLKEFGLDGSYHSGKFQAKYLASTHTGQTDVYNTYFNFNDDINEHLKKNKNSIAGYRGIVAADSLIIDIDCENHLAEALKITKEILVYWKERWSFEECHIYFSGNKGFHLEIPSSVFGEFMPAPNLPNIHRLVAVKLVETVIDKYEPLRKEIGKAIFDVSIYGTNRVIRVNNTRNSKSGLFKVELTRDELFNLNIDQIKSLAQAPRTVNCSYAFNNNFNLSYLYNDIKMRHNNDSAESEYVSNDESVIVREIEIKRFSEVEKYCDWLREVKEKNNVPHNERVVLGQLLLPFGEEGIAKIKNILSRSSNYDEAKTDYHLSSLSRGEFKPPLCATFCNQYPCKAISVINKKSPIAFSYINKIEKFNEGIIIKKFRWAHPHLLYSLERKEFFEYRDGIYKKLDEKVLKGMIADFMKVYLGEYKIKLTQINNVYERLKLESFVQSDSKFNTERKIVLKNGVYNFNTGKLEEHTPTLYHTIQLDFNYNPIAKCPKFQAFMEDIFDGDKEKIEYVLKAMCYFLIRNYSLQKIFVFFGKGRNGKGVLSRIIKGLLGEDNVSGIPFHSLGKSEFAVYNLNDKLLNISSEVSSEKAEMAMVKSLSGNDTISANRKYNSHISFENTARLLILTNQFPRFSDVDQAIIERFVIITFPKSYTGSNVNPNLYNELAAEFDGIFNLVVSKYPEILAGGGGISFDEPQSISRDITILLQEISSVGDFIFGHCTFSAGSEVLLSELYEIYKDFCSKNNYKALGSRKFQSGLDLIPGISMIKRSKGLVVQGLDAGKITKVIMFKN